MQKEDVSLIELEEKIFSLQTHMIAVGIVKGLAHPDTIECSQELDILMNKHLKIKSRKFIMNFPASFLSGLNRL